LTFLPKLVSSLLQDAFGDLIAPFATVKVLNIIGFLSLLFAVTVIIQV